MASITPETFWRLDSVVESSPGQYFPGAVQREAFLAQLRFLKHKADRARTPLSLMIFHFKGTPRSSAAALRGFCSEISKQLRGTDIVGCLDAETVGVLLPDRDESSLRAIKYAAISHQGRLPVAIATGSYPDQLFTRLLAEQRAEPALRRPAQHHFASSLPNSTFLERLQVELVRSERHGCPLSLVILDFDAQTSGNPRFKTTRHQIRSRIRNTDIVGHLSPSRLAVILPDTDETGAKRIADKFSADPLAAKPLSILAGTYPDQLFTQLLSDGVVPNQELPTEKTSSKPPHRIGRRAFLKTLHLEKRRSDRTNAPLSLVLVRLRPTTGGGQARIDTFLSYLAGKVRATDTIGLLDASTVGILLPHTEEQNARMLTDSIKEENASLNLSVVSGTYPDHVFAKLFSTENQIGDFSHMFLDEVIQHSTAELAIKRGIDIVGALTGLILFSPVMLATALAVKFGSPGPIVFKQDRMGRRGQRFKFLKFRSMVTDNDDRIHRDYVKSLIEGKTAEINQGEDDKPLYKIKSDPRVTPVGKIIRKTSLDEMPQFWNVLKGEMSLVGPRPPVPYEVEQYQAWHLRRVLEMKPGITGLWQVEGRSRTTFDEMVRLDLHYVQKWSLWMDVKILFKTFGEVITARGAE